MRSGLFLFIVLIFVACMQGSAYKESDLFFDYRISAEEGSDSASVFAQFKMHRITGAAVALRDNGKVKLDDHEIPVGKSKVTGTYYASTKRVADISGNHTFTYIPGDGKDYVTHFEFHPFQLTSSIPDTIKNSAIEIHFSGLDSIDYLQFLVTDTSLKNEGINRLVAVRNNTLILSEKDLSSISPGPLLFEFQKNVEVRFARGSLLMSYVLRRELWWKRD